MSAFLAACAQRFADATPAVPDLKPRDLLAAKVNLTGRRIRDAECSVLAEACASGALLHCEKLLLGLNQIGDAGIIALAQVIKPVSEGGSGALSQCTDLDLMDNQIGDAGITALADACVSGALDHLQDLYLNGHSFSDEAKHTMKTAMAKSGGQVHF